MKLIFSDKTITWLIIPMLLLLSSKSLGQGLTLELVSPEGQEATSGLYKVNYSVGEPRSFTLSGGGYTLTEGFLQADIFAILGGSPADSVWPGDANSDLVANMYDLLALGLAYGNTGPVRTNASNNWQGQFATNWNDSLLSGVNYKHIDCNGDGLIDDNDTLAINLNYGLTHNKTTTTEETNGALLYSEILNDSLAPGDTAIININLGTDTMAIDSLYGLAFNISLDTNLVNMNSLKVGFDNSWLGSKATNMITLVKSFPDGNINMALSRTDLIDQNGYGPIAQMIIMIDDLSGKNGVNEVFKVEFTEVRLISTTQQTQPYTTQSDSIDVQSDPTSIEHPDWQGLKIFPNPASEVVSISMSQAQSTKLKILDIKGKQIRVIDEFWGETTIPVKDISSGVYLLQLETKNSTLTRKLVIKH